MSEREDGKGGWTRTEEQQGSALAGAPYPTERQLRMLRRYDLPAPESARLFLEAVHSLWHPVYGGWIVSEDGLTHTLSTGGWSGNESVIAAVDENRLFNLFCWQSSERGGRHVYRLPIPPTPTGGG